MTDQTDPESSNNQKSPITLSKIAYYFWPELKDRQEERRLIGIGEVFSTLYSIPFLIVGIIWLILHTDLSAVKEQLPHFLIFSVLIIVFNQLGFFLIIELRKNRYGSADGSLTGIPMWAGVLIFGPIVFWLPVMLSFYQFLFNWRRTTSKADQWSITRNFVMNLASESFVSLAALSVYQATTRRIPFNGLSINSVASAMILFAAYYIVYTIFWTPYLIYHIWAQQKITGEKEIRTILRFSFLAISLSQLANPFASLAAGLFIQNGLAVFLYFMFGMLLVAYLARQLSYSAEKSRQSSRLLEKLEILSRRIINAPPDTENLPRILQDHLSNMFPAGRLVVWKFPDDILAKFPIEWEPNLDQIWPWLLNRSKGEVYLAFESLPWSNGRKNHNPIIVSPIIESESSQVIGGIYLELHTLVEPWDRKSMLNLCPAVQALADQIASAINQAKSYQKALELNKVNEQLKLAGEIQASLLPYSFPDMPGWQLAVTLDPVGETSGDFFDIIPLDGNRIGILIADVLDKGFGPALYMTLSRTLIRTYATEFDLQPDLVFYATNERILKDTSANLFVTVFFGVVNLTTGEMTYSNAGHNPPYLLSNQNDNNPIALDPTGFPLGIDEEATWTRDTVQINPGDTLILYTDGVPDAQNGSGEFYKQKSLVDVAIQNNTQSAESLQKTILDSVYDFVGDAEPFDDITLMILVRNMDLPELG
jgi:serine phosphatase RsbU (regulator of sigma subunit)